MDTGFIDNFLQQTQTSNLKTKGLYPESIHDIDIKVSFGMGVPANVPWISILGPGVSTSNGYYPVYLFYKKENILILAYGISETLDYEDPWNREIVENNEKIKDFLGKPFRYGESYVYKTYKPKISETGVRYFSDEVEVSKDDMSKDLKEIIDKYKQCLEITVKDESSALSKGLFYMESQLEDFIIQNWEESEFGKKYDLIYDEGDLKSQQFLTDIGRIDILAKDKTDGAFVVIELKRNQTSDDTVGQVTRYMGWIEDKFGADNVKGIIVAGKYDEKLYYAQKMLKNIEVFLYEVNFKLNEYKK
ncbi:MAG: hypothetical protein CL760_07590 [Chloroflexi bacterium]|nr:hypothetical protein [Chloroflexota bacterium]|tara:strand:+ start:110 stop:1021 length:912 start_codon:yes stop_codon:yes gene_type:complete